MAYSTLTDITKLIPAETVLRLTDDEGLGSIEQSRVADAVANADAEVDSYLGRRYSVPLGAVPDVIRKLSADIAVYNLYSRRVQEMPPVWAQRYRNALVALKGIAGGGVSLGQDPAPGAKTEGGVETNTTEDDRTFTKDTLEGY